MMAGFPGFERKCLLYHSKEMDCLHCLRAMYR